MGIDFLRLGKQPLANGFVTEEEFASEFFFELGANFEPKTYLVSLNNFVQPEQMFNKNYAYTSSCSNTMVMHFKNIARKITALYPYKSPSVLEIGSNDGVFIKNFDPYYVNAVEPCSNFAEITRGLGYKTYDQFWNLELSEQILKDSGQKDVVYSANCMCHIQNIQEAFNAVANVLKEDGVFIFEDPSMLDVIKNDSYDQFYDEHAYIFSLIALERLLAQAGLYIYKVEHLTTHGGSNRIYARKYRVINDTEELLNIEYGYKLDNLGTYFQFGERVKQSKDDLLELVTEIKKYCHHIVGYGATSKSTVVYNYCGLGPETIDCIIDTTPYKQGKYSPGTHIPVVAPREITEEFAFLGAWNYKDEILAKERYRKFKFITHVPKITIL